MNTTSLTLSFDALKGGELGISAVYGSFLAEAAFHCLHFNRHVNPAILKVTGDVCVSGRLNWGDTKAREKGTWADLQEATEYGGYGVAIIVALRLTQIPRVERSAKGTGIDYWLGEGDDQRGIFQRAARLEVSGILKGDETKIRTRLANKLAQMRRSENTGLPGYAVVVDFGGPEARLVRKPTSETRQ